MALIMWAVGSLVSGRFRISLPNSTTVIASTTYGIGLQRHFSTNYRLAKAQMGPGPWSSSPGSSTCPVYGLLGVQSRCRMQLMSAIQTLVPTQQIVQIKSAMPVYALQVSADSSIPVNSSLRLRGHWATNGVTNFTALTIVALILRYSKTSLFERNSRFSFERRSS